ncbi:MAG: transcription antitermination factor NusB [Bdellovibrionaceae bacterium]|nr:transcription antitermination factor NusB [Pseudobdellovibrionaceae bacterium]
MKTPRRRSREVAFQYLYHQGAQPVSMGPSLIEELHSYYDHFEVPEELRSFASELIVGSLQNLEAIDSKITTLAKNWRIDRIAEVDRCLLRLSLYEIDYLDDIPTSVTMDEAIEIAKQFGTAESPSFINGILDAASKERNS